MENRLQELTDKLYAEGLSKGQAEGERILAQAKADAEAIVKQARAEAAATASRAKADAQELQNTTRAELRLASAQLLSELQSQVERTVTMRITSSALRNAWADGEFVKQIIVDAVKAFSPTAENPVKIQVPENQWEAIRSAVAGELENAEVVADSRLKTPFRIAVADGSYYVSFAEGDFEQLFKAYLRPAVKGMLFNE